MKKKSAIEKLNPVAALKDHSVALDAAMLVAGNAADVGAVHKLRTNTRRVEAHLRLLDLAGSGSAPLPLPEHENEVKAVAKRLRTVRRAAGAVRDLDVQIDLIAKDAPPKAAVHDGSPGDTVRREAKALRRHLKQTRKIEVDKLIGVLGAQQGKLAASLRSLEEALKPSSHQEISGADLERTLQAWLVSHLQEIFAANQDSYTGDAEQLRLAVAHLDADALHAVRKTAKLCRYMAEAGAKGASLQVAAARFEAVQQAGGAWHDWLLMTRLARGFHGRKSELAVRYTKHRDAALEEYRLRLAEMLPVLAAA